MNRKDKLQKIHDKLVKRSRKRSNTTNKERYICKADRAKAALEKSEAESKEGSDTI